MSKKPKIDPMDRFSAGDDIQFLGTAKLVTEDVTPPDRKEQNRKHEEMMSSIPGWKKR